MGGTACHYSSSDNSSGSGSCNSYGWNDTTLSVGAIVGIVIGGLIGVLIIIAIIVLIIRLSNRRSLLVPPYPSQPHVMIPQHQYPHHQAQACYPPKPDAPPPYSQVNVDTKQTNH